MLTERFGIKPSDIDPELAAVEVDYKKTRKPLLSRLRYLNDIASMQTTMFKTGDSPIGATVESTKADIKTLKKSYSDRTRHLNALKRVLLDEDQAAADAMQSAFPTPDTNG